MISPTAASEGSYSAVASEYYDHERHPTTANFQEGSSRLALRWLPSVVFDCSQQICEVGAGRSLVGEWLFRARRPLSRLTVIDASATMLRFSEEWKEHGARLLIARSEQLPLRACSQDVVVALLGDPYNNVAFWAEVARVLTEGGRVIFTSPSYEWASQYRQAVSDLHSQAVFDVADGRRVGVPSVVMDSEYQIEMISQCGLQVLERADIFGEALRPPHSPKIWPAVAKGLPIVSGYLAAKL